MAIVAEGERGRVYLSPTPEMEAVAAGESAPETEMIFRLSTGWFRVQEYGMARLGDLFTSRQLVALTTFSDLVREARERVMCDALTWGSVR